MLHLLFHWLLNTRSITVSYALFFACCCRKAHRTRHRRSQRNKSYQKNLMISPKRRQQREKVNNLQQLPVPPKTLILCDCSSWNAWFIALSCLNYLLKVNICFTLTLNLYHLLLSRKKSGRESSVLVIWYGRLCSHVICGGGLAIGRAIRYMSKSTCSEVNIQN